MALQFDHFVHLTPDPTKAAEAFQQLGLHAVQGGKHEKLGTYNTLSYFDLSYVELIGIFDEALVSEAASIKYSLRDTFVENHLQAGPQRIALRSENLQELAERFRAAGLEVHGPTDFSRTRPDGTLVTWKLLFAGKENEGLRLPFFIEWDEKDAERRVDLTERGVIAPHLLGDIQVDGAAFAVRNIEETAALWSSLLQLEKGESYEDEVWNAKVQRLTLQGGDIVLYEPIGDGVVADVLATGGEQLFALQLKGATQKVEKITNALYRFV